MDCVNFKQKYSMPRGVERTCRDCENYEAKPKELDKCSCCTPEIDRFFCTKPDCECHKPEEPMIPVGTLVVVMLTSWPADTNPDVSIVEGHHGDIYKVRDIMMGVSRDELRPVAVFRLGDRQTEVLRDVTCDVFHVDNALDPDDLKTLWDKEPTDENQ